MFNYRITTDKLLTLLADRGLRVTRNMLAKDVEDNYLPPPQKLSRGFNKGVVGMWDYIALKRAIYLYRLRKRGLRGQILKVFLFLKDGWGWEEIRPICLAGIIKQARLARRPVLQDMRKPTRGDVMLLADEGIEMTPSFARLSWGIEFFGEPLKGGSIKSLYDALHFLATGHMPPVDNRVNHFIEKSDQLISTLAVGSQALIAIVNKATNEQVKLALFLLTDMFRKLRRLLRCHYVMNNIKFHSTNLLTFGGRSNKELARGFRELPTRITPAQYLAGQLGPLISLVNSLPDDELMGMVLGILINK